MTIGFKANNDGSVAIQVNGTDRVSMTSAGAMSVPAGVTADLTGNVTGNVTGNAATATQLSTASGAAPSYSARAWVNFNGTGTVAIRASGNVSSITDGGVGTYTVNFTTALTDANFSAVACSNLTNTTDINAVTLYATTGVSVFFAQNGAGADPSTASVIVIR